MKLPCKKRPGMIREALADLVAALSLFLFFWAAFWLIPALF